MFEGGAWVRGDALRAGGIGKLWGLSRVRVGDAFGRAATRSPSSRRRRWSRWWWRTAAATRNALRVALGELAEQDPLINVRQDDRRAEISVSLYGEVQKEVIRATLANDYGLSVAFRETTMLCVERPVGTGEAVEILNAAGQSVPGHDRAARRAGAARPGVAFRLRVDPRTVPMNVYKNVDLFAESMGQYVRATLQEGLAGWPVTDCVVTMVRSNYSVADGPPSQRGPDSTAADFRQLTPLVLMAAVRRAGTAVCEPTVDASLEVPAGSEGPVLAALTRLGASVRSPAAGVELSTIEATLSARRVQDLLRQLPGLTSGEGVLETRFGGYVPVIGAPPSRPRTTANPLHREEYLMSVRGKPVAGG